MSSEIIKGFVDDFMASLEEHQVKLAAGKLAGTAKLTEEFRTKLKSNAKRDIEKGGYVTESELLYRFLDMTDEQRQEVLVELIPGWTGDLNSSPG